jgi:serine/threonine-protein kinase
MGVIVAAFHLQLDQLVALKFLLPDAAKDREVVSRFAREARAAAKIQSEHVARVLDVGTLDTGAPYMVMEYLEGHDLDDVLKRDGTLPVPEAVSYVLQACEAVAEAHALGIVHRDLKPANLFLAERTDGSFSIKVLDFGISKVLPDGPHMVDASLTRTSAVIGSPMYMSPEQLRSARDVDIRADIWSLGVILYEMVCGKGPFSTGTVPEVCAAILKDPPQPPHELREDVPPGLEAIVLRCLQKEPPKRYANIAELAAELLIYGPPGSERSMERISRVLRRGAASLRGAELRRAEREGAAERAKKEEVPLELAETKASGANASPAAAERDTEVDPSRARAPELSATASASTLSSWKARNLARGKLPRSAALAAAAAAGVMIVGVSIYALSRTSDEAPAASPPRPALAPPPALSTGASDVHGGPGADLSVELPMPPPPASASTPSTASHTAKPAPRPAPAPRPTPAQSSSAPPAVATPTTTATPAPSTSQTTTATAAPSTAPPPTTAPASPTTAPTSKPK